MSRLECEWLAGIAATVNSWTELGAYCGRSMLCVGLHLPKKATLQVVDISLGTVSRAGQTLFTTFVELRQKRPDLNIVLARMDSVAAAELLKDSEVVFVDANHNYENVVNDITAWRSKCRILCGHDWNQKEWPTVVRAVRRCVPNVSNPTGSIWVAPTTRDLR
ncbi:class I SAM-dependent methyltransferase [Thalassoglobus neptunius]|nr:class I SAM-dependent methyltransferase [Thalassoglobus neptunius]